MINSLEREILSRKISSILSVSFSIKSSLKYFKAAYKYEPMKDGDKIKWVYLKPNPLGLESVGLTGYNDPKEILDLVEEHINYELIWQKELENKLNDFYEAMAWEKPNPNLAKASQFFGF